MAGSAFLAIIIHYFFVGPIAYQGSSHSAVFIAFFFFIFLYTLSRNQHFTLASYLLIGLYFCLGLFTTYTWGGLLPQGPLIYALVIIKSSVLISTRVSLVTMGLISICVLSLKYLRSAHLITTAIRVPTQSSVDILINVVILGIIALVSWLSNREIEKSLQRARQSEVELKKERDFLEVKVTERTRELRQVQFEQMSQLYRFAEFGKLSSGLVHDLLTPLTTVSISLKQYRASNNNALLQQALHSTQRIEAFIESARKQIRNETNLSRFSIEAEIKQAIFFLAHKANLTKVELRLEKKCDLQLYGNPVKFNQILSNLLANAIDAFEGFKPKAPALVLIQVSKRDQAIELTITDNGKGIESEILNQIFDPFFSTKKVEKGSGIGLSIVKDITQKDFRGSIQLHTEVGIGTTFVLNFPLTSSHDHTTKSP